jgi:glycosyltransferase involved in cell wall biosynthesis
VIVNDGSKDRTGDILSRFSGQAGMVIVHQSNQGKTAALLTGFKNATGDIFLSRTRTWNMTPINTANF